MNPLKSFQDFLNEVDISDIFRMAHGMVEKKDLVPLKKVLGKPGIPNKKTFDEVVEYLGVNPDDFYYNDKDFINRFVYWKGANFLGLIEFSLQGVKMMRTKEALEKREERLEELFRKKDYKTIFSVADKKILFPLYQELYKEIPDDQKYDIFSELWVRSEYGFSSLPKNFLEDVFSKRFLSAEWKKRMKSLEDKTKEGKLKVYRGETEKSENVLSWSLSKKTAEFFAKRFSSSPKRILSKEVDVKNVIDYLDWRGEDEVLIKESLNINHLTLNADCVIAVLSKTLYPLRFFFYEDSVRISINHPNMGWIDYLTLDKDGKFQTNLRSTEFDLFLKLKEVLEKTWTKMRVIKSRYKAKENDPSVLFEREIFREWMKSCEIKYKTKILSSKFGL